MKGRCKIDGEEGAGHRCTVLRPQLMGHPQVAGRRANQGTSSHGRVLLTTAAERHPENYLEKGEEGSAKKIPLIRGIFGQMAAGLGRGVCRAGRELLREKESLGGA